MGLNKISLPAIVLQDLYKNAMVQIDGYNTNKITPQKTILFLGNNKKNISIIVADEHNLYLADDVLNFLIGVLAACKLSMSDVALINIFKPNSLDYLIVEQELNATTILLLGVASAQLHLPLQFPNYQIQKYNNQVYLAAPALPNIMTDKIEKIKLWNCLKQIFNHGSFNY